jgi:hypothetical protein
VWRIQYFETVAQIGPVLLLAYVLEERIHSEGEGGRFPLATRAAGLVCTLYAESWTLGVVAGIWGPTPRAGMQIGGLFLLSVAYLVFALAGGVVAPKSTRHAMDAWLVRSLPAFLFGAAALVLLVLSYR